MTPTSPPRLRVLWASDHPDATSGYSVETKLAALRLKDHCDLALLATFGLHGSIQEWNGIPLFPGGADAFANDVIAKAAKAWQADVVITLKDTLVFNPQSFSGFRWCVPGHTMITLADDTEIAIKDLVESRYPAKVKAWDGQRTVAADILDFQCIPSMIAGQLIEIETEGGENLHVTAENEVLILRNSALQWVKAACVIPGDVVYCCHSIPSTKENNHGTTEGHVRDSYGTNAGTSAATNDAGMGIRGGNIRWRGDDLNQSTGEAYSLGARSANVSEQYEQTTPRLAGPKAWDAYQWPQSCGSKGPVYSRNETELQYHDTGFPGLSHPQEYQPVSDCEEGTKRDRDGVYGEPRLAAIQRPVHTERDQFVAPGAGFKPRRVSSVQHRGRPYPLVYDITTTTGNFVAGGILIHNCPMTPCDHDPGTPQVIERVRQSYRPIAYAPHGFRALRKAGLDPLYAPHAFDPAAYHPIDKSEARGLFHLPDDLFLVGMVAVNRGGLPSRKAWVENLEAFARFAYDKPNARLFLHTDLADDGYEGGIPLRPLMAQFGILDKVLYCDQERYRHPHMGGFSGDYMRHFYNALDVLNAVSLGEGFGIPVLESQACGVPVIVGDWCAHEDLCFAGWKVEKKDAHHFFDQQQGWVFIPQPAAIAARMNEAHALWQTEQARTSDYETQWNVLKLHAEIGAAPYQIDTVIASHWLPLLAELTRDIRTPRSRGVLRIIRREEVFST